ncbi:heterokaryon incompatibility [Seiridium cupressi]
MATNSSGKNDTVLRGRLIDTTLRDCPEYHALSYVWGCPPATKVLLLEDNQTILIRNNLFECLRQLTSNGLKVMVWADQICIDQSNESEKEHQVRLMSRIFRQSKQVVGWIGKSTADTTLAFHAIRFLGLHRPDSGPVSPRAKRLAQRSLMNTGNVLTINDIFNHGARIWQVAAMVVQMPWFNRLWVVQEVVLATQLTIQCGSYAMCGKVFFAGVESYSATSTSPPMPELLKPFRNALKLGRLRKQASSLNHLSHRSFPYLAQILSEWHCEESQDRLNALHGMIFRDPDMVDPWFVARYTVSVPALFEDFARRHIQSSESLEVLHFTGCGDGNDPFLIELDHHYRLLVPPQAKDIPSWIPDWRIQTRPFPILPIGSTDSSLQFSATISRADYSIEKSPARLRVRARIVDQIVACGVPYCDALRKILQIEDQCTLDHWVLNQWYDLARRSVASHLVESMYASTLLMGGRLNVVERSQISIDSTKIDDYFSHWATRNLIGRSPMTESERITAEIDEGLDKSTHFGYEAEEICRNRTFFVTKNAATGWSLGIVHGADFSRTAKFYRTSENVQS